MRRWGAGGVRRRAGAVLAAAAAVVPAVAGAGCAPQPVGDAAPVVPAIAAAAAVPPVHAVAVPPVAGVGWVLPPPAHTAASPGAYRPPLAGPIRVVRAFDPPPKPWLPGHRGVDLAGVVGAPVHAAGAGTVAYVGVVAGRGVVSIGHPGGLRTTYEPVTPSVGPDVPVTAGTVIGSLNAGHPRCPAPVCLHWGLRY
ncbi:MAG TPA: peptidoglycan DD-metalloendopeptidase family protein [Pilimelia sp.]|nr:peptidoglycan DD-metalloendopeptidase family protein [Pilimelia sp.]